MVFSREVHTAPVALLLVALAGLGAWPAAAASVRGQARATVSGDSRTSDLGDAVFVHAWLAVDNGFSQAGASYTASLASATLSSYASANGYDANAYLGGASAEVKPVSFADVLWFTVPAGYHASGLNVLFHGFTQGSLFAQGCRPSSSINCSNGYQVADFSVGGPFGSDAYQVRKDVDALVLPAASMDAFFTLHVPILIDTPSTLAAPLTVSLSVGGSLTTKGTALGTYGYPGDAATMFTGEVWGGFTSIEVPDGVTWISQSGLFLSQPVPEPGTALSLIAGLGALAALVGRRRATRPR